MPQILAFGNFIMLLLQIFPHALRAWRSWEEHSGEKLSRDGRVEVISKIKASAETAGALLAKTSK